MSPRLKQNLEITVRRKVQKINTHKFTCSIYWEINEFRHFWNNLFLLLFISIGQITLWLHQCSISTKVKRTRACQRYLRNEVFSPSEVVITIEGENAGINWTFFYIFILVSHSTHPPKHSVRAKPTNRHSHLNIYDVWIGPKYLDSVITIHSKRTPLPNNLCARVRSLSFAHINHKLRFRI